jgi:hypothetical protein
MSRLRQRRSRLVCVLLGTALSQAAGCGPPSSRLELRTYADPFFPETRPLTFENCVYQVDAGRDLHIAACTTVTGQGNPGPTTQLLHVHLFWEPKPGRTPAESSGTDAVIRYALITPTGTAIYSGTGFVYPKRRFGPTVVAKIEAAALHLESLTGSIGEPLGDARLRGTLTARRDDLRAVDLIRQLDLHAAGGG